MILARIQSRLSSFAPGKSKFLFSTAWGTLQVMVASFALFALVRVAVVFCLWSKAASDTLLARYLGLLLINDLTFGEFENDATKSLRQAV